MNFYIQQIILDIHSADDSADNIQESTLYVQK